MKPKDVSIKIHDVLIKYESTTKIVSDSAILYTPFICFEKKLNNFATITFRIHVSKRHKYLYIENNAFIRVHSFDELYATLNDAYINQIGKIYYSSFAYFEPIIKHTLIKNIEIKDDDSQKVSQDINVYINSFVIDYQKIFSFLESVFTEGFIKKTFNDYKGLIYENGDAAKLICPSTSNSKLIELAGLNIYSKTNIIQALAILKELTAKNIDEISRNSYNKLVHKICELNNLDFKTYESVESPISSILSIIKRNIYKLFNKYKFGFNI